MPRGGCISFESSAYARSASAAMRRASAFGRRIEVDVEMLAS